MRIRFDKTGYFKKLFVLFLMFILIPLVVVSIVFFLFLSKQIRQTYIEGQENLVHAIISEAEDTIRMAANSLPRDSVIAFFNDQFTGGSGIMTVKVFETEEMDPQKLKNLKESLPSDQLLIDGTFLDGEAGYYVIVKLTSEEIGLDSYLFFLILFAAITATVLSVVAFFASRKITKPVSSLYKTALDSSEINLSAITNEEHTDPVDTIAAVFEEMNHDMRASKELIGTYSSAAKAYSLILYLEKNIPLTRFLETNTDLKDCNSFLLCGIKLCNDIIASHYLLNLSRLITDFLGDDSINLVSPLSENTVLVLLASKTGDEPLESLTKELYDVINPLAKTNFIMAISSPTNDISALPRRSKQLDEIISTGLFYDAYNKMITRDLITRLTSKNIQTLINDYYPRFVNSMLENDRLGIEMNTDRFFDRIMYTEPDTALDAVRRLLDRIIEEQSLSGKLSSEFSEIFENGLTCKDIKKNFCSLLIKASGFYRHDESVNTEKKLCENVAAMLVANYSKDIDMMTVASRFSVSYSYLSRIFKNNMNMTLTDYLNKYRIDRSCELLKDKSEKLEAIALQVGYNNIQSYQRFFKKFKGTTPTLYKKSVLQI